MAMLNEIELPSVLQCRCCTLDLGLISLPIFIIYYYCSFFLVIAALATFLGDHAAAHTPPWCVRLRASMCRMLIGAGNPMVCTFPVLQGAGGDAARGIAALGRPAAAGRSSKIGKGMCVVGGGGGGGGGAVTFDSCRSLFPVPPLMVAHRTIVCRRRPPLPLPPLSPFKSLYLHQ